MKNGLGKFFFLMKCMNDINWSYNFLQNCHVCVIIGQLLLNGMAIFLFVRHVKKAKSQQQTRGNAFVVFLKEKKTKPNAQV